MGTDRIRSVHCTSALLAVALAAGAAAAPCPDAVRAAAAAVGRLHGEPPLEVACETVTPGEVRRRLRARLERELPLPLDLYLEALVRLGLVPGEPPERLANQLLDLLEGQVLGYYEPDGDRIVVVERLLAGGLGDLVWVHELEHARQQRRFGLPARVLALAHDGDAQMAAAAVAEGDAVLVMAAVAVASERPTASELAEAAAEMLDAFGAVADVTVPGVPRFFVRQLVFPYVGGLRLVVEALRRGGWAAVDALQRHPPASTEQVLHPERHDDEPTPVTAGELPPLPPGWEPVYADTVGEWALREWLGGALPPPVAAAAAAGWDGDRLRLARRGRLWRLDLVSVWDGPTDADEALQAFLGALPRLLRLGPGGTRVRVERRGTTVRVTALGHPAGAAAGPR